MGYATINITGIEQDPNAQTLLGGMTRPGKIPVVYIPINGDQTKITWVASVNITGSQYYLTVDNTISNTWLYSPSDPYKCTWERVALGGEVDFCYRPPEPSNTTEQAKFIQRTWPFSLNFTGPGGFAVSGTHAILNNITGSIPGDNSDGAHWPAVIGLIDNTFDTFASGSSPDERLYHGSLGLSRTDAKGTIYQASDTPNTYRKLPQTAFNNYTTLTYFTTNFNPALEAGQMSLGLGYMNDADYTGNWTTVPTSAQSDGWAFDANQEWKVKIWENITTTNGVQEIVRVVPFPAMNVTKPQVILDLSSRTTYVDFDTAEAIYKAFDGSCTRTPTPMGYSNSQIANPEYPYCTLPVVQRFNRHTGQIDFQLKTPAKFSLPWGPEGDIMITDELSLVDSLEGVPCANKHRPICEGNVFGSIQPNSYRNGAKEDKASFWVYGDVVYKNAYLKWDTAGSVSMAKYAMPVMQPTVSIPKPGAAVPRKGDHRTTKPGFQLPNLNVKPKTRIAGLSGKYKFQPKRQ
ncbi:hypothetical protein ABW21_db0206034 [Orbilia brochopaga]|nr:hypothetical protein ABW21_db0206034 [Drechslerella brochopaga]